MDQRLELQQLLESLLPAGSKAYFQPPASVQLVYPCIIYQRDYATTDFADNKPYRYRKRYQVTVIDRDPDSVIPDKVAELPLCVFNRHFKADNLNHDVFQIFF